LSVDAGADPDNSMKESISFKKIKAEALVLAWVSNWDSEAWTLNAISSQSKPIAKIKK